MLYPLSYEGEADTVVGTLVRVASAARIQGPAYR